MASSGSGAGTAPGCQLSPVTLRREGLRPVPVHTSGARFRDSHSGLLRTSWEAGGSNGPYYSTLHPAHRKDENQLVDTIELHRRASGSNREHGHKQGSDGA